MSVRQPKSRDGFWELSEMPMNRESLTQRLDNVYPAPFPLPFPSFRW